MALELLALALWLPLAVLGLWLLVTGQTIFGLPKGLKKSWQLRLLGLAYVLMPGYLSYRAIHDGSYAIDGLVIGYILLVAVVLAALYRRQKARRTEAVGPQP
jgi:hypothetical protein